MRPFTASPSASAIPDPEQRHRPDSPSGRSRLTRRIIAATVSSALVGVLALVALVLPALNPYAQSGVALLSDLAGPTVLTVAIALLALVSVIVGLAALFAPAARGVAGGTALVAFGNVIGLGLGAQGTSAISIAGYLVALVLPVAVVVLALLLFRSYRSARVPLLVGVAALIAVGVWLWDTYVPLVVKVIQAFVGQMPENFAVMATVGSALVWGTVLLRQPDGGHNVRSLLEWATRHRIALTILAALGPLPYVLIRLTWLTPWPQLAPVDLDTGTKIWGVLLSLGAWVGIWLTIGLIRPWGERLPRWFPVGAGNKVPPLAAIVPGSAVALMVTAGAVPMLMLGFSAGKPLLGAVMLPFWYWGPMLALAVLGYAGHRAEVPGPGSIAEHHSTGSFRPSTMDS